jgi:hypothetical protein
MSIPVTFTVLPEKGGVRVTVRFGIATEAGQRLDNSGRAVKPHFVEELAVQHNNRTVMTAYLGPAMARNPQVSFRLEKASPGETIAVSGKDNRDTAFEASHRIA